jgi:hypothetical protein
VGPVKGGRAGNRAQVLVLPDYALYQAKGSGRNRAVGLLPAGESVRGGTVPNTINGIPASPVTTSGPNIDEISPLDQDKTRVKTAAAASTT